MASRMTIRCGDEVRFTVSIACASPSALGIPLWLKLPANANERASGKYRWRVIEGQALSA